MNKYKIKITEHYSKVYEIEASSEEEALALTNDDEYMPPLSECVSFKYWVDRRILNERTRISLKEQDKKSGAGFDGVQREVQDGR